MQATWQLTNTDACLRLPRCSAKLNVLRPGSGLSDVAIDGRNITAQLLKVDLPAVPDGSPPDVDWYERCGDLVATYPQSEARAFRTQIYWRGRSQSSAQALAAIELVASVQTSLLDSRPELTICSQLASSEVLQLKDTSTGRFESIACSSKAPFQGGSSQVACYLVRLSSAVSYAEMVHPLDRRETSIRPVVDRELECETIEIRHRLFISELEKGVILRSRVLGVIVPREEDEAIVARSFASFAAAEPPLTT